MNATGVIIFALCAALLGVAHAVALDASGNHVGQMVITKSRVN